MKAMKLRLKPFCALQWPFGVQLGTMVEQVISTCIVNAVWWEELKKNKLSILCLFNSFYIILTDISKDNLNYFEHYQFHLSFYHC